MKDCKLYRIIEACSLSGAIVILLFSLTAIGVILDKEKVWQTFGASLTTFISAKHITEKEVANRKPEDPTVGK
jgi:hypothetical protein